MENLKNLEKIAKIFQPQNIITSEEIDQVLKGIMEILASYKKGTDAINEETKAVVNILLDKVVQSNKQTLDKAETVLDNRISDLETLLKDVKQMINDVEEIASNVKDGKDADEEKIVEDVVNRIKLEPTIVTLSAEEVRDRLSSLKDEARLDKSAIKGLDKILQQTDLDYAIATLQQQTSFLINKGGLKTVSHDTTLTGDGTPENPLAVAGGGSGITLQTDGTPNGDQTLLNLQAGTNITLTDNGTGTVTIDATGGGGGSPGGSTTQLQYNNAGSFGGISGATTDGTATTYTTGNLKAADVKASGSGGLSVLSNAGTQTALFGAGGGANNTFYGDVKLDYATATTVPYIDASKNLISSAVTPTELGYLSGVTSAIQTQLNAKGSGTVTNTGGNLTANSIVLGAGTNDTKVVTGITTDGTSIVNLGVNATTAGKVKMFGGTSGDVTLQPTAAAGTATTQTLPATTGTLVNRVTTGNGVSATNTDGALAFTLGAITPTTVNGNTITTGTGTLTLGASKTLTVNNSLTLAGTDGTTMTFPSTSATIARTDAANTFTGVQSMTSPDITTSITTPSTSFSIANSTATTLNIGGAATTFNMAGGSGAAVNIGGGANAAELRLLEPSGSGTNYTGFKAPTLAANVMYTMPTADGSSGQFLSTNGSGTLSWATGGGGGSFIGCKLTKSAAQSLGNNTYTSISFDGETFDTDSMHDNSTDNTRITFTTAGKYMIVAFGPYITNNCAIGAKIRLNGTTTLAEEYRNNTNAGNESIGLTYIYEATATDYVEFMAKSISGNFNANTTTTFSAYKIG